MANKIDIKTVDEVAHLARLEFTDEAKAEIANDMNRMLTFIDKLNELDTEGIEPLIYMTDEFNVMRDDIPVETLNQKYESQNFPFDF